ncbi:MAG: PKD domain-containing protein [Flavobacteriales bacterium]|nr:PKD domain-containing protein [Flavobacteriales bacterium]
MKKLYSILVISLFSVSVIYPQSFEWSAEPGTCGGNCDAPLNGNGTLGQIYNNQQCGLNFVQASNRIGQRFSPAGTGNPSVFSISGIPPCANNPGSILKAYLWAGTSGNGAAMTVSITNPSNVTQSFPMTIVGSGPDKCWGYSGSYTYRADVTSLITGNGNYTINGFLLGGTNDVDGATLMIIYQDPQATYRGHIILHDGAVVVGGGSTTQTVTGINACSNSTYAVAFSSIADLQMAGTLTMNGTNAPFTWNWWNYTQVNTNITNGQPSSNFTMNTSGDCFNFAMAGIYYQTTSCVTCTSSSLTLSMSSTDASCAGNVGTATVTPSGGSAPYTYQWSTGANSQTISNLAPGTYTVTVTASGGCLSNTATVTIGTSGTPITLNTTQTNISCNGASDGSLAVVPSNGTGGYTYVWTPNIGTIGTITNLSAGSYTVTVTDGIGCSTSATYVITQPALLTVQAMVSQPVICSGDSTDLNVIINGGSGTMSIVWNGLFSGAQQTVTPTATTQYTVLVTDSNTCKAFDTVMVTVNPLPQIAYSFSNACENQSVAFTNATNISSGSIISYQWNFGDGVGASTDQSPSYTYTQMGNYQVELTASSDQGCQQTDSLPIQIYDVPIVGFSANQLNGCAPLCVLFDNTTSVIGANINTYNWTANGVGFASSATPSYCFQNSGIYTISLQAISTQGCSASHTINDYLTVYANPIADFALSSNYLSSFDPYVQVTDLSMNAVSWDWDFGDGYTANVQNPVHSYTDTGKYCVNLVIYSLEGCTDDTKRCLIVYPEFSIHIPNTFTPNDDKVNDVFFVHAVGIETYEMRIFNRWGECLFSSDDLSIGWNGTIGTSGNEAEQGVYVYRVEILDSKNDLHTLTGHVNLIR